MVDLDVYGGAGLDEGWIEWIEKGAGGRGVDVEVERAG